MLLAIICRYIWESKNPSKPVWIYQNAIKGNVKLQSRIKQNIRNNSASVKTPKVYEKDIKNSYRTTILNENAQASTQQIEKTL